MDTPIVCPLQRTMHHYPLSPGFAARPAALKYLLRTKQRPSARSTGRPRQRRPRVCLRHDAGRAFVFHYPQVTVLCSVPVFAFSIRQVIVHWEHHSCRHTVGFLTKPGRGRLSFSSQLPDVNYLLCSHNWTH